MKTITEHIEYVRAKPHHIRKQIAYGLAAAASACVALIWFAGSYAMGGFAIGGSSFATSAGQGNVVATTSASENQNIAGVGAAAALSNSNAPAHIEIVDTTVPASAKKQPEQTILPF